MVPFYKLLSTRIFLMYYRSNKILKLWGSSLFNLAYAIYKCRGLEA